MSKLLIIPPMPVMSAAVSRGTGVGNLLTADPKEVWADVAAGTSTFTIDLGSVRSIDTILLGYVRQPGAAATWSITGGVASAAEQVIVPSSPLRVPDVMDDFAISTHALWHGTAVTVQYLSIVVNQPTGAALTAGVLLVGKAFVAELGQEWGSGRQPIDTGTATPLPSGGFAIVEGARKRHFTWTFGDLTQDEAERIELIALDRGETAPILVVEDAARTAGLRSRIHYGRFRRWTAFERKNRRQTRWELGVEEWL